LILLTSLSRGKEEGGIDNISGCGRNISNNLDFIDEALKIIPKKNSTHH